MEVPVEAVDHDDAGVALLHGLADSGDELPGRELGGIDLLDQEPTSVRERLHVEADAFRAAEIGADAFVEDEDGGLLPARHGLVNEMRRQQRLAGAGRPHDQRRRPPRETAAHQRIERGHAARQGLPREAYPVRRGYQPREHLETADADDVVVVAVGIGHAAQLHDAQTAPDATKLRQERLEPQHAVRERLQLQVAAGGRPVVQEEHGAIVADEKLLERKNLSTIAQRIAGQQPHLRQRVEHDAPRANPLEGLEHGGHGVAELDLGRVEDGVLAVAAEAHIRRELVDVHAVERPAVGCRHRAEFVVCLREGDVERGLAPSGGRQQELQSQRRLAGAGITLHQIEPGGGQTAAEDRIQPFNGRFDARRGHF